MRLGNREFQMHVIVAEVKGGAFWVWTSCHKLIHCWHCENQVFINGEMFDCSDFKNQLLCSRCTVRRLTMIEPNTEVIVAVIVQKRSFKLNSKSSQKGMRLLEPCLNWHLQQKGLYVARTLVDVKEEWSLYVFSTFLMKCFTSLLRLWLP